MYPVNVQEGVVQPESMKRVILKHCVSNLDNCSIVSWPCSIRANCYCLTKLLNDKVIDKILIHDITNTKYHETEASICDLITYKVEACYKIDKSMEENEGLFGSLEQAVIKGNTNTLISDYIELHYDELLNFIMRLPHVDITKSALILNDVWLSWMRKEQSGVGYSAERVSRGGTSLTVQQVVENTIKSYAKNTAYSKKYNNKDKNNGIEIELHSVSMLEEREEGSENNYITSKASIMNRGHEADSPLDEMVEICTLKEDLEYVMKTTKNYKVSAKNIFDNINDLLSMVTDNDETGVMPSEELIKNMNKTLFSEYSSNVEMVDMFSRIFMFMHKDISLFNEIYKQCVQ